MSGEISLASSVARQLVATGKRVVFAESCTAGLVAATLAGVEGASAWLCGSAVTYREATKIRWLDVSPAAIRQGTAVSREVTSQMAVGVLHRTEEADLAFSVTGHLGPNAPPALDGLVFVAAAGRLASGRIVPGLVRAVRLQADHRVARQREAVDGVLQAVLDELAGPAAC